ncbi:MAG: LCP family protein, partial [Micrococcales bacterium]|nr:LCP family protein [Micrococcales bacterium]
GAITNRSRSDVNQLLVVNPSTGKVLIVNTPRDYYVQLAGTYGLKDKLTHSGVYGIDVSIGTLQNLYGITINYYLRLNFTSIVQIVNALGGIDVDSDVAFTTTHGGYQITKGMNHLNGDQTLGFVRERYQAPGGDRGRGVDQQAVIEAIIKKLEQPSTLSNYTTILAQIQAGIQTSMPNNVIAAQVKQQLSNKTSWSTTTYSVDGSNGSEYTYSYPHQKLYVMIPDQSTVNMARQKIAAVIAGQ